MIIDVSSKFPYKHMFLLRFNYSTTNENQKVPCWKEQMVSSLVLISQTPEQRLQIKKTTRAAWQLQAFEHLKMGFLAGIHFYFNHSNHQTEKTRRCLGASYLTLRWEHIIGYQLPNKEWKDWTPIWVFLSFPRPSTK